MSHAVYQTPGFILATHNAKEANKRVVVYTQKFGLLWCDMQSVRKITSKMRYHVHAYALVDLDLISGKSMWRITGVHEKTSAFQYVGKPQYRLLAVVASTLQRLCTGEDTNDDLWMVLSHFLHMCSLGTPVDDTTEVMVMVRILAALGYWKDEDVLLENIADYSPELGVKIRPQYFHYIRGINDSLHVSQL